jgi:predicted CXXCH cytochrome family protein
VPCGKVARVWALILSLVLRASAGQQGRLEALAQCADCHPAQAAFYVETGMARALGALGAGDLGGLAPVREAGSGFEYAFEGDGASARVVESYAAPGSAPRRDSAPIAFAIGAGELDRAFALLRHGRLWLAPLEVAGHGAGRHAALAPGHSMAPGTRFAQPITPECLVCHTDRPPPRAWPLNLVTREWEASGISCGACHGAPEEHVRARSAELAGEEGGADPLLAEREMSRVQRMERCAACHLQGDARIELDPRRVGPPPPGSDLLAARAVFVAREPAEGGAEIGFVSQVQRLVLSRCYLESRDFPRGGLACDSCHDPHRSTAEALERLHVREACRSCHGPMEGAREGAGKRAADCALSPEERPRKSDCVACHMRKTAVFDVAGVEIHDHRIERRPTLRPGAKEPLRFPESPAGDWRIFEWPDRPGPGPADDPGLWTMALAHGGHVERALEQLRRGPGTRAAALAMLHHVRGSLLERAGELPAARAEYERALALDPDLAEAAVNLGPVLARLGEPRAALAQLDRLVERHPLADGALRNRAALRLALGDEPGARGDLEAAMKLLPDAALAQALARLAEQRGDAASARRWSEEARALDPRLR